MSSASATVLARGFSQSTCLPAWRAAIAIGACVAPGVQMSTRSTSSRAINERQSVSTAAQPSRCAAASVAASSRPQIAAIRGSTATPGWWAMVRQACECARPMNA